MTTTIRLHRARAHAASALATASLVLARAAEHLLAQRVSTAARIYGVRTVGRPTADVLGELRALGALS